MTLGNVLLGFVIGFPMMIAVGPISVLLLDQGLQRGVRRAAPAVLGVAAADLTLSTGAVLGGSQAAAILEPIAPVLRLLAVAVLLVIAAGLARAALAELRGAPRTNDAVRSPDLVASGVGSGGASTTGSIGDEPPAAESAGRSARFDQAGGAGLAAAFYGITLVHPLALVLLVSLVVAGGPGVGTGGWALGMALASLVAHGAFAVAGGLLGSRLSPVASGRLRLGAALFMGALAVHFAVGS